MGMPPGELHAGARKPLQHSDFNCAPEGVLTQDIPKGFETPNLLIRGLTVERRARRR